MAKNIELEQLVINKLTQEQFDSIEEKNPAELYFITDAEVDGGKGAQVEEMPEATEMNAGQIVQYVGETIPDVEATAIITQTVGDSLTDLKVDTKKFEKASGLTEAGSLEFYTTGSKIKFVSDELPTDANQGLIVKIDSDKFFDWLSHYEHIVNVNTISRVVIACVVNDDSSISDWGIEVYSDNNTLSTSLLSYSPELPEESGISYEVAWLDNFNTWCRAYFDIAPKNAEWLVNNQVIDINQYGITYSGTPSNGDTLKVDCTPFVGGYEKGYFYVNQAQLSEPIVTIEQTVGTPLSDLSIDVDKFIEAEQPTENVAFDFVANVVEDYIATEQIGDWDIVITNPKAIFESLRSHEDYARVLDNWTAAWINYVSDLNSYILGVRAESIDRSAQITLDDSWFTIINAGSGGSVANITEMTEGSVIWHKNNTPEDLNNYGISYNGTPSNGDTVTVNYVTPSVVAHNWNQINVQPSSKSSSEIEWVTKVDLPADYPESYRWSCHPIWTIPGGVPDGTYEFYFQSLCGASWEPELGGIQNYTVKVLVKFYTKNDRPYHFGAISYVLDGTWTGDANFRPTGLEIYYSFKKGNNNLYFWYDGNPFKSSLPAYIGSADVPGIFKMSAWKNIDSGETYIPEGMLYTGDHPRYEIDIEGYLNLQPLCPPVNYPSFYVHYKVNINENNQYARIGPGHIFKDDVTSYAASAQSATFDIKSESGGTFYATTTNKNGSCVVQELESSGDLKNVQLGVGNDGNSYIYFNNNDLSQVEVLFSLTGMGNTENGANIMFESWVTPSGFTPLTIERVGAPITALNLGKTLQYTQDSTEEYTQGYFYKATGGEVLSPASIDVIWQNPENVTIEIDADKLVTALNSYFGMDIAWLREMLQGQHNYVYYNYETPYIYCSFYGDIYEESIVSCFKISNLDTLENGYVEFSTQNYRPEHIEIVNGKWEQVNVQPASGGGGEAPSELPNLTGNEGRFLSNNGSELEWADVPTSLPAQEGHSGKYLTTDGENASWVEIELPESTDGIELPDQTGNSGKFLTTDGANLSWAEVSSGGGTVIHNNTLIGDGSEESPLGVNQDALEDTVIVMEW